MLRISSHFLHKYHNVSGHKHYLLKVNQEVILHELNNLLTYNREVGKCLHAMHHELGQI